MYIHAGMGGRKDGRWMDGWMGGCMRELRETIRQSEDVLLFIPSAVA